MFKEIARKCNVLTRYGLYSEQPGNRITPTEETEDAILTPPML